MTSDSPDTQWAIEAEKLTKRFGSTMALRGIDLQVKQGEFLTVFGPNGAGKSTLIRILATIGKPSSGSVKVQGLDCGKQGPEVRRLVGLVPHQTLLYDDLTVYENLLFFGRMYRVQQLHERIKSVTDNIGLSGRISDRVRALSRGLQQRVSIARALLHDPPVLLLDEPETGLDREALSLFEGMLGGNKPKTVVMTTHRLEHGLKMAGRVLILVKGRITYDAPAAGLGIDDFLDIYCRFSGVAR
jgi:heme ABC exporter ATP-binding subunit CcmA